MRILCFFLLLGSIFSCVGNDTVEKLRKLIVANEYDKVCFMTCQQPRLINKLHGLLGMNALQIAVRDHRVDMVKWFLSQGADVKKETFTKLNVLHYCGQVISSKKNPCLPLLLQHGYKNLSQQEFKEWIGHKDWQQQTPADICKDFSQCLKTVKCLIKKVN